jgi:tagatose-1,6-bisphosphate aldolase non-catalytic subunit AgaZ/GatZ
MIQLRQTRGVQLTLLAVCPNSAAVLEAAVKVASQANAPMLFAATLNQVDRDGGYTGWTPMAFVQELERCRRQYRCASPLYPCLDHGGPWLKDRHTLAGLSLAETAAEVKRSLTACIQAGYSLLHIDPTVDRTLPPDTPVPIEVVVDRTVDLIAHCEAERTRLGAAPVSYEVGTEEVHGGLVDMTSFQRFVHDLHDRLARLGLDHAWPCFVVGKVGTDLHTSFFDPDTARRLFEIVAPLGSLVKGHYTDWVANPEAYPASGMGGANVGPEFTSVEFAALEELAAREVDMQRGRPLPQRSGILEALEAAVLDSNRWRKWLQPDERGRAFAELAPGRRQWLVRTGARYIWTDARVLEARAHLYANLAQVMPDPAGYVVDQIAQAIERYVTRFRLFDAMALLEGEE